MGPEALGLLGIGTQIWNSEENRRLQRETNDMNVSLSREARQWEQDMSNTAHQRQTKDLIAAGLNPILSTSQGGASTPNASAPLLQAPQIELPDLMAYGVSLKQMEQRDKEIANSTALTAAQIANSTSDTELKKVQKILANKGMIRAEVEGEAAGILRNIFNGIKKSIRTPPQPSKQHLQQLQKDFPETTKAWKI